MARTFTEQASIQVNGAGGSNGWTGDGEGMHALIAFDNVRHLNNIATKVNNFGVYAQGIGGGAIFRSYDGDGGDPREVFMAQFPIVIPPWRVRMLWTAGVTVASGTIEAVTTYLSPAMYNGAAVEQFNVGLVTPTPAFDSTFILGATSSAVSMSSLASGYGLAVDSSTGVSTIPSQIKFNGIRPMRGVVVVTITGGDDSGFYLNDYSCWFNPE